MFSRVHLIRTCVCWRVVKYLNRICNSFMATNKRLARNISLLDFMTMCVYALYCPCIYKLLYVIGRSVKTCVFQIAFTLQYTIQFMSRTDSGEQGWWIWLKVEAYCFDHNIIFNVYSINQYEKELIWIRAQSQHQNYHRSNLFLPFVEWKHHSLWCLVELSTHE